jgi:hypothetical protein
LADRFKKPKPKGGNRIAVPPEPVSTDSLTPVICLRHLQNGYDLDACSEEDAKLFLARLHRICKMEWRQILSTNREGNGCEKMPKNQLPTFPRHLTEDVTFLLSFRFSGIARFLALRDGRVLEIYFIDPSGDAYKH